MKYSAAFQEARLRVPVVDGMTTALLRNALLASILGMVGGCVNPMTLNGSMDGNVKMEGTMAVPVKIEGPIEVSMKLEGATIKYKGTYISDDLLKEVVEKQTSGEWILAVFGEPDKRTALSNGTEIWKWAYQPEEQQVSMIQVFGKEEKEPSLATRSVFVQLRDGVVVKKWKG